jgi:proliferating cell nuclear antigen
MLVKLENPALLVKPIELISDLVMEVRIKINEVGLSIVAVDPANVAMVGFVLPRNAFSQFEAGEEVLGINLDNLKRILKRCGAGSSLILEKKDNLLEIQIQGKIKRIFTLNLIDIESSDKEMPQLEYTSRIEINSADFISSIEDCSIVSDACSFVIDEGKFIIQSKGLNSAISEFTSDEVKIEAEDCKSKYSLEYLQKFIKGSKLAEKTILKFSEDHPLKIEIRSDGMELSFILAPRVEKDD